MPADQQTSSRPGVSVLMPFLGDHQEAAAALTALALIKHRPDDEIVVADNSPELVMCDVARRFNEITAIPANEQQSAYYARNVAAAAARNPWLLFTDADCIPDPDILDRYFAEAVHDSDGAIAGEVIGDPTQHPTIARYQRDRGYLHSAAADTASNPRAA
jgi:GT2 family glycosyltransferase